MNVSSFLANFFPQAAFAFLLFRGVRAEIALAMYAVLISISAWVAIIPIVSGPSGITSPLLPYTLYLLFSFLWALPSYVAFGISHRNRWAILTMSMIAAFIVATFPEFLINLFFFGGLFIWTIVLGQD
jgi:hypothetical protein